MKAKKSIATKSVMKEEKMPSTVSVEICSQCEPFDSARNAVMVTGLKQYFSAFGYELVCEAQFYDKKSLDFVLREDT